MRKKGFTLIELLAVIVILAIIALIAVPIIMNIINDSKKQAVLRSAENYLTAASQAVARENLNNKFNPSSCDVTSDGNLMCNEYEVKIEVDGEKPSSGTIAFEDGKIISLDLIYSDDHITLDENGNLYKNEDYIEDNFVYIIKNGEFVENEFNSTSFVSTSQEDMPFGNFSVEQKDGYYELNISGQRNTYNMKSIKLDQFDGEKNKIVLDGEVNRNSSYVYGYYGILGNEYTGVYKFERSLFEGEISSTALTLFVECFFTSHTTTYKIYNLYIDKSS